MEPKLIKLRSEKCWETPDPPSHIPNKSNNTPFESGLKKEKYDPKKAFQVFESKSEEQSNQNGSSKKFQREFELGSPSYFESPLQKLQRLKRELNQFSEEISNSFPTEEDQKRELENPLTVKDFSEQIQFLQSQIKNYENTLLANQHLNLTSSEKHDDIMSSLSKNQHLSQNLFNSTQSSTPTSTSTSTSISTFSQSLNNSPSSSDLISLLQICSSMEQRITTLEKQKVQQKPQNPPLLSADETYHPEFGNRVLQLEKKINLIETKLNDHLLILSDNITDNKQAMNHWEELRNKLPILISRLQTLKTIHDHCSLFPLSVQTITNQQNTITNSLSTTVPLLIELKEKMNENMKTIQENVFSIDQRINAIISQS